MAADIQRAGQSSAAAGQAINDKVGGGALEAEVKLKRLVGAADELLNTLKLGVGIDLGGKIVDFAAALPAAIADATARGIEFNSTVENARLGIATIAKQFNPDSFPTVGSAFGLATTVIEQLKKAATESPASLQDLAQALSATAGAALQAGIPLEKQAQTLVLVSNATAGLGIAREQLAQEYKAILTGEINNDAQLAKTLGITREMVEVQKGQGKLLDFLTNKLGAFGEAGALASKTYSGALSNLGDTIDQVLGDASTPVFDTLRKSYLDLSDELKKPEVADSLRAAGFEVAHLVEDGAALTKFALENADALLALTRGTVAFAAAVAAVKLSQLVLGLYAKVAASRAATVATTAETAAIVANTEANVANAAAKGAAGTAGSGAGLAGRVAGVAGPLAVAVAVGTALNAVIRQTAADTDAAAKHAGDIGESFDRARGSAGSLVGAARDETTYTAKRAELEKSIADLKAEVKRNTFEVPTDAFGGTQTVVNSAGQVAAQFLQEQQKNLELLDKIKAGQIDVSNIKVKDIGLQRAINDLTSEQAKQASALAAALNARRLADAPLTEQAQVYADTLERQVAGAKERLGLLGVDPKSLASIGTANGLFELGNSLRGTAKLKALEEATALALVEDKQRAINKAIQDGNALVVKNFQDRIADATKRQADAAAILARGDRSTPEADAAFTKAGTDQSAAFNDARQAEAGLKMFLVTNIPALKSAYESITTTLAAAGKDVSESGLLARRQLDAARKALEAIPAILPGNLFIPSTVAAGLAVGAGAVPVPRGADPNAPVDYGATGYGPSAAGGRFPAPSAPDSGDTGPLSDANFEETARSRVPAADDLAKAADGVATAINEKLTPAGTKLTAAADALPGQLSGITTPLAALLSTQSAHFDSLATLVETQQGATEGIGQRLAQLTTRLNNYIASQG